MEILQPSRGGHSVTPGARTDPVPLGAPGESSGPGLEALKVMVVDDEFLAAWHLQTLLEDMGVQHCELAHDGPSALALAERFEPDLVLMDMNLGSGIDGAETARRLLESRALRLIFITAYGDAPTLERIQACAPGAAVLVKPASPARLRALVAGAPMH